MLYQIAVTLFTGEPRKTWEGYATRSPGDKQFLTQNHYFSENARFLQNEYKFTWTKMFVRGFNRVTFLFAYQDHWDNHAARTKVEPGACECWMHDEAHKEFLNFRTKLTKTFTLTDKPILYDIELARMDILMFCGDYLRQQQHAKYTKTMTKKSTLVKEKSGRFEASWYDNTRTLHINMGTTFVSRFLFPSLCVVYVQGSNMLKIIYQK